MIYLLRSVESGGIGALLGTAKVVEVVNDWRLNRGCGKGRSYKGWQEAEQAVFWGY